MQLLLSKRGALRRDAQCKRTQHISAHVEPVTCDLLFPLLLCGRVFHCVGGAAIAGGLNLFVESDWHVAFGKLSWKLRETSFVREASVVINALYVDALLTKSKN